MPDAKDLLEAPSFSNDHEFCCGNKRRCPRAKLNANGSVTISDDEAIAFGGSPCFDPEQATLLRQWLQSKGF